MSTSTSPGMGGGVGSGTAVPVVGAATGVVVGGVLPQTGSHTLSLMVVTAIITFLVMIVSNTVMRFARWFRLHRA